MASRGRSEAVFLLAGSGGRIGLGFPGQRRLMGRSGQTGHRRQRDGGGRYRRSQGDGIDRFRTEAVEAPASFSMRVSKPS